MDRIRRKLSHLERQQNARRVERVEKPERVAGQAPPVAGRLFGAVGVLLLDAEDVAAGGVGEAHRVFDQGRVDVHLVDLGLQRDQALRVDDGMASRLGRDRPLDDHELLGWARVADQDLHHEPVDLGLGQGIGPLGLDRVLGGHDEERPGDEMRLPADRDLLLLHHLEEGALHLRRRAVDLVGQ